MADYVVIEEDQLEQDLHSASLQGHRYPGTSVSVILVDMPPGGRVRLHRHPYPEIFIVHEGQATFTVGEATLEVRSRRVVIAAAGVPHAFVNSGDTTLRQTDIHLSDRFVTEWLED